MTDEEVETIIRQYLPQVVHMSLATCVDNKPWVSEVHFAYDDELNLYFISTTERRHSLEIAQNPHVAGDIVTQHFLNQLVRGVYFEGTAEALEDAEALSSAYRRYDQRLQTGQALLGEITPPGPRRIYKITVSDYYLFDSYKTTPPQKFHLARQGGR